MGAMNRNKSLKPSKETISKPRLAMMNKCLWSLALASVALGSSVQQVEAGLPLPLQHLNNTTFDPNTGLEWLDLRLTAGQSYSNVLNGWNGYTTSKGFRFATRNEIGQLFTNAGALYLEYPPSPSTGDLPAAERTLSLLGTTLPQFGESRSWMFYDPSTEPTLPSSIYGPSAVFGVGQIFAGYPQEGFFMVPGIIPTRDYSSPEMASALVRAVPEPSVLILVDANFGWRRTALDSISPGRQTSRWQLKHATTWPRGRGFHYKPAH